MTVVEKAGRGALSLEIEFGSAAAAYLEDSRAGLRLPLPRLGGETTERIFSSLRPAGEAAGFQLFSADGWLLGCGLQPATEAPEAAALELYRRLLRATDGRWLYRVWNYVPDINGLRDGFENYRAFSAGRAQAFEEAFGADYRRKLPAASAVGCLGGTMAAIFVAGSQAPRHVENPEQISAYHYPPKHGPSPPSFSRSTIVAHGGGKLIFISGTAAIKGHETVAPGALEAQLECTLDNLRLMSRAAGIGENFGASGEFVRHFKIYLRRAGDLPAAMVRLKRSLLRPDDQVVWLQADLCRAELDVEIEATLVGK
ncbi:MAG TPA: hypothetical protein VK717_06995 [Opitutaceae bacterium]|nr:hypothetical protein [Opitutaceae bacterium]